MIVVADSSVLVAKLHRRRGRELLSHPDLRVVVAEDQWNETEHELEKRLAAVVRQGHLSPANVRSIFSLAFGHETTPIHQNNRQKHS